MRETPPYFRAILCNKTTSLSFQLSLFYVLVSKTYLICVTEFMNFRLRISLMLTFFSEPLFRTLIDLNFFHKLLQNYSDYSVLLEKPKFIDPKCLPRKPKVSMAQQKHSSETIHRVLGCAYL